MASPQARNAIVGVPELGTLLHTAQMEQLHDKILAKRAETERQLGQISAAVDVAMRSANAGQLDSGGQLPAAFLALPRFQVIPVSGREMRSCSAGIRTVPS